MEVTIVVVVVALGNIVTVVVATGTHAKNCFVSGRFTGQSLTKGWVVHSQHPIHIPEPRLSFCLKRPFLIPPCLVVVVVFVLVLWRLLVEAISKFAFRIFRTSMFDWSFQLEKMGTTYSVSVIVVVDSFVLVLEVTGTDVTVFVE